MASVILTNWTVYYSTDASAGGGYKQIRWTGSGAPETSTNTVNELYSAVADLFSISTQNDAHDTNPIIAVTPAVYQIGAFDAGDREPWFIDPESIKHLTGGSIQTVLWTRDTSARTGSLGIYKITRTGTNIVSGDVGAAISNGTYNGYLLYVDGTNLWIRPTASTSDDDWTGTSGTITCNGHSDTQVAGSATSERLWSNIYTIGTIEAATRIYIYQNFSPVTGFWSDGHIDRLFLTNDGFASGLIDYGYFTVYARQYTKLYDHFLIDVSAGGRNPVPLSTSSDVNNTSGFRQFLGTLGVSDFDVGNYIYAPAAGGWAAATKRGILTAVGGTAVAPLLSYYPIGELTDFALTDTVKEYNPITGADGDGSCTAGTPIDIGPAGAVPALVTIGFAGITRDLGNGNGLRHYSIEINLQGVVTLAQLYERIKYLDRRGQTTDIETQSSQSIIGQEYRSVGDLYIPYDTGSQDNPFTEGETITATGSFTGVLSSKHDRGSSEGFIIVRNTRGTTPIDNITLTGVTSTHTALVDTDSGADPVGTIAVAKTSPFGTYAGGIFFGARGVWLTNVPGADASNYELIDSEGVRQVAPATISINVNGVVAGDRVSVFRALDTNGTIDKTYLTSHNTNNVAGDTTFDVTTTIPSDTPATGQLRVVNNPNPTEHRFRYTSWSGTTFTLVTTGIPSGTIDAVGDVTGRSFRATNADLANVLPGDLVRNTSDGSPGSWALVVSVTLISGTTYQVVHSPLQGGTENDWDVGDGYSFNNLPVTYSNSDTVYVPYIDQTAVGTSISVSMTYVSNRNITTQVRKKGIIPFNVNNIELTSSGYTATAVRTTDSIVT